MRVAEFCTQKADGFGSETEDVSGMLQDFEKLRGMLHTACGHRIDHRKWKETKLQPGTAGPGNMLGCCLVSFHFMWAILCPQAVHAKKSSEVDHG